MAPPPTINKRPITDPLVIEGLAAIQKSPVLRKLHNADSDFTEKELGKILDRFTPGENLINLDDAVKHFADETGISPDQFVSLAKEYQAKFPNGSKRVLSFWKHKTNFFPSKRDIDTILSELIQFSPEDMIAAFDMAASRSQQKLERCANSLLTNFFSATL